jgi:hypothetical protein
MVRCMTLHQQLEQPIALPEGGYVRTVGEALNFYFSLPMQDRIQWRWTEAAKLLVATFDEDGEACLNRAEGQFRLALSRHVASSEKAAA